MTELLDIPRTIAADLVPRRSRKPVTLTVERFKCNPATATAKERCGGVVVRKLKRSDFGMKTCEGRQYR